MSDLLLFSKRRFYQKHFEKYCKNRDKPKNLSTAICWMMNTQRGRELTGKVYSYNREKFGKDWFKSKDIYRESHFYE